MRIEWTPSYSLTDDALPPGFAVVTSSRSVLTRAVPCRRWPSLLCSASLSRSASSVRRAPLSCAKQQPRSLLLAPCRAQGLNSSAPCQRSCRHCHRGHWTAVSSCQNAGDTSDQWASRPASREGAVNLLQRAVTARLLRPPATFPPLYIARIVAFGIVAASLSVTSDHARDVLVSRLPALPHRSEHAAGVHQMSAALRSTAETSEGKGAREQHSSQHWSSDADAWCHWPQGRRTSANRCASPLLLIDCTSGRWSSTHMYCGEVREPAGGRPGSRSVSGLPGALTSGKTSSSLALVAAWRRVRSFNAGQEAHPVALSAGSCMPRRAPSNRHCLAS